MLKKLKTKFLIATLITLFVVIGVIIGTINFFNYKSVISDADDILAVIMDNSGNFPSKPELEYPDIDVNITPESPYESRYFTVKYENGKVKSVNTSNIAAINDETAIKMANTVIITIIERGFRGNYRYLMHKDGESVNVIFLDCTKLLDSANTFFLLSLFISLLGILAVFLIMWIISDRIVKPLIEGHEKQKRFITDAGHDIKTPITIIGADAELLEMEIGENEWLSDIRKQSTRLASLTKDLIYLARMEEMENIPHVDFPISDLVEEVISSFSSLAKTKKMSIDSRITPALFYHGEEEAIRKLVTILIDNAIKYSPENESVTISLKRLPKGIVLKVINPAPDLTEESIANMFDRFYRLDSARSTSEGFGIGLSVAYAIVSSHKGKITAQKQNRSLVIEVVL